MGMLDWRISPVCTSLIKYQITIKSMRWSHMGLMFSWKRVKNLFELNKILGIDDSRNNILVTLTDGRCALVDVNRRGFVVEILLDSFYKWMSFSDDFTEEDVSNVKAILATPEGIGYGPLAEEYVINPKIKRDFDEMKKEIGYEY